MIPQLLQQDARQRIGYIVRIIFCLITLLVAGWTAVLPVRAGQDRDSGSPPYQVAVDLEFEITIPKVLYLRVGTPGEGNVDRVEFDLRQTFPNINNAPYSGPEPPLGTGTAIPATSSNLGGQGVLPVEIQANSGNVSIQATVSNSGGLSNGQGQFIPFNEIQTVSSDSSSFPAPILTNSGSTSVNIAPTGYSGLVTLRTAAWTYMYRNTTQPAAGTYTGIITYTATLP